MKHSTYFFIYIYKNANTLYGESNISIFKEFYVSRDGRHSSLAVIEICEIRVCYTLL